MHGIALSWPSSKMALPVALLLKFAWRVIWGFFCALFSCFSRGAKAPDLSADVCVVTGAAQGLGRQIALQLAECGATLVLWDIDKEKVRSVASEIREGGRDAYPYVVDCSNREEVYRVAAQVREEVGDVAVLINNAGIGIGLGKSYITGEQSDEVIEKTFSINILAQFWTVRAFLPWMMENNYGYIVNIGSITSFVGWPYSMSYSAAKAAVRSFSESLRYELLHKGKKGISVTCVYPAAINTRLMTDPIPLEMFKKKGLPIMSPEDVAKTIVRAMGGNKFEVFIPSSEKVMVLLKRVVPQAAFDVRMHVASEVHAEIQNKKE